MQQVNREITWDRILQEMGAGSISEAMSQAIFASVSRCSSEGTDELLSMLKKLVPDDLEGNFFQPFARVAGSLFNMLTEGIEDEIKLTGYKGTKGVLLRIPRLVSINGAIIERRLSGECKAVIIDDEMVVYMPF